MSFYSTLADAYDDLVLEQLSDILTEYPKVCGETEIYPQFLDAFNERMKILYLISRATTDFPPLLNWSDKQYERGYARCFILPFLNGDEISEIRCDVEKNDRLGIIIEFISEIAKLNEDIKKYIILFSEEADENEGNDEIPEYISDAYPFARVLHSMTSD
jgi:hypothetical protein